MATKNTIKEIKAPEGYYLTQVAEVGDARQYLTAIKGVNVNEADWREATEEEKLSFQKTQEDIPQQEI